LDYLKKKIDLQGHYLEDKKENFQFWLQVLVTQKFYYLI